MLMDKKKKEELLFPYKKAREVQDSLIKRVSKTISNKNNLIIQAPVGTGKTAGTLPVALKESLDKDLTTFFLTPRHTQHQIAIKCLKKIGKRHDKNIIATDLIGKRWMCPVPEVKDLNSSAFLDYCKEAREEGRCDFYNNLFNEKGVVKRKAKKLLKKLKEKSPLSTEEVFQIAKRKEICPYYLSLELAKQSEVIIGDYYHIFNPPVRKALFGRASKELEDSIIIVDEGHNLPKRVRGLLTSQISNYSLRRAKKEAEDFADKYGYEDLPEDLEYCLQSLKELEDDKLENEKESYVEKEDFVDKIEDKTLKDIEELIANLLFVGRKVREERKQSYCASTGKALDHWMKEKESYARILKREDRSLALKHKALDSSLITEDIFNKSYSSLIMSGTLIPTKMYKDVLGMKGDRVEYPSPFPLGNRLVLVYPGVTTKYSERGGDQFDKIANKCLNTIQSAEANSAIFLPSYSLLKEIKKRLYPHLEGEVYYERKDLSKKERLRIFKEFKKNENSTLLAVASGSFSGGMDFPGDSLELVIIVGVPLARPTLEVKSIISYYDKKFPGSGWQYGYIYPAIRRTLQAAGRAIRSETDKGAIVLMDERYLWKKYSKPLPNYWDPVVTKLPAQKIRRFLGKGP